MSIFESTNKKLDEVLAKKKAQSFEQDRAILLKSVATDLAKMLEPVFERTLRSIADKQVINVQQPAINLPAPKVNVNVPDVNVPEPKVTVNVPRTIIPDFPKIPKLEWPEGKMPIEGWVQLMGVSVNNPLPVQLRDAKGNPVDLSASLTQVVSSGGGGRSNYLTISKILDSTGNAYSTTNPMPVTITSGSAATTATNIVDSSGVAYSGSNPVPVTGTVNAVVGGTIDGITDPIVVSEVQGTTTTSVYTRQTNPTAVASDLVKPAADDLGRTLIRPVQVRDLTSTAYVTLTSGSGYGTEKTLLSATAGSMFDLIYIMGTNSSDVAAKVDIRGVTGGNVLMSLVIPGGGTSGVATPVPIPQTTSDTGNAWTVDAEDVTGTNLTISALFTKEV